MVGVTVGYFRARELSHLRVFLPLFDLILQEKVKYLVVVDRALQSSVHLIEYTEQYLYHALLLDMPQSILQLSYLLHQHEKLYNATPPSSC
jgi:hypothetical protein